jgi:ATP-dependent Clp protease ATP-binding subunit ClpX
LASREGDSNREWKSDVQRAMLKFVEGGAGTSDETPRTTLVLAGGAFSGIDGPENIRKRRPEVASMLKKAPKGTIVSDDILNYGFMPELVARLPAIIQYEPLSEYSLLRILEHKETSPLIVWRTHFSGLGKELRFSEGFLKAVAKRAATLQMGARGLQQIVFPALARHAYAFETSQDATIEVAESILEFGNEPKEAP